MNIELKKLCANDGKDIYNMLQELPEDENGFINPMFGKSYDEYKEWLEQCVAYDGGTIGYSIRPSARNKGFGTVILSELLEECSSLGVDRALLTIKKENISSINVALKNHGVIEKSSDALYYIWIACR